MPLPARYAKLPKDARAKKLRALVKQRLAAAAPRLITKLTKLASAKFPADASLLGFELELASTNSYAPIAWCISKDGEQLGFASEGGDGEGGAPSWKPPVPFYQPIMKPVKVATPAILKAAKIKDDEWSYYTIIEAECLAFTHACWHKAGGKKCTLRTIAQEHDAGVSLDLKTGKWKKQ